MNIQALPTELLCHVLSFVPKKDLPAAKQVCKGWHVAEKLVQIEQFFVRFKAKWKNPPNDYKDNTEVMTSFLAEKIFNARKNKDVKLYEVLIHRMVTALNECSDSSICTLMPFFLQKLCLMEEPNFKAESKKSYFHATRKILKRVFKHDRASSVLKFAVVSTEYCPALHRFLMCMENPLRPTLIRLAASQPKCSSTHHSNTHVELSAPVTKEIGQTLSFHPEHTFTPGETVLVMFHPVITSLNRALGYGTISGTIANKSSEYKVSIPSNSLSCSAYQIGKISS